MFRTDRTFVPLTARGLTPAQVSKAYNFPAGLDVSHRTVAILELGGAFKLSDVVSYCKQHGYKIPEITTVFTDGASEVSDPQGADGEVALDIEVIAGVAQGCKIAVVFAPNTNQGFIDGIAKCVALNPDAISISWGSPVDGYDAASLEQMDALFKQAEEKGINVFAAAGDNGSSDGEWWGNHTDYPAASPYVIACGGTNLQLNADGTRAGETVWSSGGGGICGSYSTPSWQSHLNIKGRGEPDLSGNADPNTGYLVTVDGQAAQVGGTSAVAPLMAAFQLLLNASKGRHVGNMHTKMYTAPQIFYDVTKGSNGAYNAAAGWDACTGLGVIDGIKALEILD